MSLCTALPQRAALSAPVHISTAPMTLIFFSEVSIVKLSTSSQELLEPAPDSSRASPRPAAPCRRSPASRSWPARRSSCAPPTWRSACAFPWTATVDRQGTVVLPARLLLDVVRQLPAGDVTLELRPAEQDVEVVAGTARFHIRTLRAEDFPPLPEPGGDQVVTMPAPAFVETIARVARSASRDETRPILTGILVSASGDELRMVATDSYRLSVKETRLEPLLPGGFEANVPARALEELGPSGPRRRRADPHRRAREPGRLRGRRRRPLVAPHRRSVPELPPAAARGLRARAAGQPPRSCSRSSGASASWRRRTRRCACPSPRASCRVSAQTPDVGEASRAAARPVRRRTVRDRLQPGLPARRPGERGRARTSC